MDIGFSALGAVRAKPVQRGLCNLCSLCAPSARRLPPNQDVLEVALAGMNAARASGADVVLTTPLRQVRQDAMLGRVAMKFP